MIHLIATYVDIQPSAQDAL